MLKKVKGEVEKSTSCDIGNDFVTFFLHEVNRLLLYALHIIILPYLLQVSYYFTPAFSKQVKTWKTAGKM